VKREISCRQGLARALNLLTASRCLRPWRFWQTALANGSLTGERGRPGLAHCAEQADKARQLVKQKQVAILEGPLERCGPG